MKSETTGYFRDLLAAMMKPLTYYYVKQLHKALSGISKDEYPLIEIMCTMSNHEITIIQEEYEASESEYVLWFNI